jgi:hypothetical protein
MGSCDCCLASGKKLYKCGACDVKRYCNEKCQRKDWKRHREECKLIAHDEDMKKLHRLGKIGIFITCFSDFVTEEYLKNPPLVMVDIDKEDFFSYMSGQNYSEERICTTRIVDRNPENVIKYPEYFSNEFKIVCFYKEKSVILRYTNEEYERLIIRSLQEDPNMAEKYDY